MKAKAIKDQIVEVGEAFRTATDALDKRLPTLEWNLKVALWLVAAGASAILWLPGLEEYSWALTMKYVFGLASKDKLKGLHPDLLRVVRRAMSHQCSI